ncbi:glycosyl hydrolase family 18 protein [Neobacillus sp. D3-1R]|uniref:glycosyl hydrolase family 18 protein n=1 Tax=Neobacillus sp. D3-1R TaxID=3445778 RepID=UPI003FA0971B
MAIHIVRNGDTLLAISQKYRVSIPSILNVNGLDLTNYLMPGLALYIPTSELPIRTYRIRPRDTLWNLSKIYNTSVSNIIAANPGVNPNFLSIGQKINIPSPLKMNLETLGFILPTTPAVPLLSQLANQLTYLAIVSYSLTNEGWGYVQQEDLPIVTECKRVGIKPLLLIRNYQNNVFSPELIGGVLGNPVYRRNLILSTTNLARQRGYEGVSIDFEFIPPANRNDFILFLKDLKGALGNLILHVNVHAKTEDIPNNPIIGAYDYQAIGKFADIVGIMTIDYGYPGGPPDPISPVWWVDQVLQYATTLIPSNKIQIAFPLYAYNWRTLDNKVVSMSNLDAQNFALQQTAIIQYDLLAAESWYQYWSGTEEHIVWFEDIRSITEKYKLIDFYQLRGATFWHIGLNFPQNWSYLGQTMNVMK